MQNWRGYLNVAKKRLPDDRMDRFLSRKEKAGKVLAEHIENTDQERYRGYKKTELETFSIRLTPEDKRNLREYFERRSLSLSQGIRMIIKEFMEREGV